MTGRATIAPCGEHLLVFAIGYVRKAGRHMPSIARLCGRNRLLDRAPAKVVTAGCGYFFVTSPRACTSTLSSFAAGETVRLTVRVASSDGMPAARQTYSPGSDLSTQLKSPTSDAISGSVASREGRRVRPCVRNEAADASWTPDECERSTGTWRCGRR